MLHNFHSLAYFNEKIIKTMPYYRWLFKKFWTLALSNVKSTIHWFCKVHFFFFNTLSKLFKFIILREKPTRCTAIGSRWLFFIFKLWTNDWKKKKKEKHGFFNIHVFSRAYTIQCDKNYFVCLLGCAVKYKMISKENFSGFTNRFRCTS